MIPALAVGILLLAGCPGLRAQSDTQNPPSKPVTGSGDNPFPEDTSSPQKTPSGQTGGTKPDSAAQQKKESDNPFPGEDPNAPVIPVAPRPGEHPGPTDPRAGYGPDSEGSSGAGRRDPDGDPVRSPDLPGHHTSRPAGDDGFSSSLSGVNPAPQPDGSDAAAKAASNRGLAENVREDVNVGQFYSERKNWKAAQARFAAAFAGDKENPDAVWGLAEAERHLGLWKEADEHYKLFLTYDPTGPHGKAARKGLAEVEAALNSPSNSRK